MKMSPAFCDDKSQRPDERRRGRVEPSLLLVPRMTAMLRLKLPAAISVSGTSARPLGALRRRHSHRHRAAAATHPSIATLHGMSGAISA